MEKALTILANKMEPMRPRVPAKKSYIETWYVAVNNYRNFLKQKLEFQLILLKKTLCCCQNHRRIK